jgi:2-desacetyl-2-hydroxyethyl bacteriochlorophyllide A dehydrogenase
VTQAALLTGIPATDLELRDVPEPRITRDDEAIVAVSACGVCGTDLHIMAGASYRPALPFTLGHEPVGTVVAAGTAARDWVGTRVTMTLFEGCGVCRWCRTGNRRLCPEMRSIVGVAERAGAFAEYVTVPADQLVRVSDALGDHEAAALVDAGATAANAARAAASSTGRSVVVGGGPVGFLTAALLRSAGREVTVVEPLEPRRRALDAVGIRVVGHAEDGPPADIVVECSGAPAPVAWALEHLAPEGLLVLAGYSVVSDLDLAYAARKELHVRGVRSGSRDDLEHVLALAAAGEIPVPPVQSWPLTEINHALAQLRAGTVHGKAVIAVGADPNQTQKEPSSWTS